MRPEIAEAFLVGIAPPLAICGYLIFGRSPDAVIAVSLALIALALIVRLLPSRNPLSVALPWPFLAILAIPFLQCIPMPRELWLHLTSLDAEILLAAKTTGILVPTTWSIQPEATLRAATDGVAAMAAFLLCRRATRHRYGTISVAGGLLAITAWQALRGLNQYLAGVALSETGQVAHGIFVNRGHYAAFLGAGLWLALGATVCMSQMERRSTPQFIAIVLTAFAALFAGAAIIASQSRAALLINSGLLLVAALLLPKSQRRIILFGMLAVPICLLFLQPELYDQIASRLNQLIADGGDPGRLLIWKDGLHASLASPVGAGANNFPWTFERTTPYFLRKSVDAAHSDYVQWAVEYGPVIAAAILATLTTVLAIAIHRSRSDRDWLTLTSAAAATVLALHGTLDSVLHTPAVAVLFGSVLGLGLRAPTQPSVARERTGTALLTVGLCASTLLLGGALQPLQLSRQFATARQQHLQGDAGAAMRSYQTALTASPRAAPAWLGLADLAATAGDTTEALRLAQAAHSVEPFTYRVEWALAGHLFANGEVYRGVETLKMVCQQLPDLRPGAYLLAWKAGAPLDLIETQLTAAEPYAVGEYLAFLIRSGNHQELAGAYERLVHAQHVNLSEAHQRYLSSHAPNVWMESNAVPDR